jgi:hypothetical protein
MDTSARVGYLFTDLYGRYIEIGNFKDPTSEDDLMDGSQRVAPHISETLPRKVPCHQGRTSFSTTERKALIIRTRRGHPYLSKFHHASFALGA